MNFFKKLFSPKLQPEDYYHTIITDESVRIEHPKRKTEEIFWNKINEIKLINTDSGPASPDIWLALLGDNSGCLIPHGSKGFDEVYEIISKYENFDFENVTKSMQCTDNNDFLLWESEKNIQAKIRGYVFIENEEIGFADFEIIDDSMGVIGGYFNASENYKKFKNIVLKLYSQKGSANNNDLNFSVILNNIKLNPKGGICLTDSGNEKAYIDCSGNDFNKKPFEDLRNGL